MDRISVALIGSGYWGSKLKKYIEGSKKFNLKCVCNSKSDLSKIWKDKSIEAVVIATPNSTHFKLAYWTLLSEKHVMVEKPLALTTKECVNLHLLSRKKKKVLLTEYTYTFSRALKKAREIINSGELGNLIAMDMSAKHLGRFGGGSVYWLLGSHMLSVLDMFHPIKKLTFKRKDILIHKGEIESGIITFDGTITGQISLSLNYPWKETHVVFYCEYGTIKYNPRENISLEVVNYERFVWTVDDKLPQWTKEFNIDEKNNLKFGIEEFYDCIKGSKKDNITRAVQITRILEDL